MMSFPVDMQVKTIEGYVVVDFEVVISYSFRDIKKNHFVTAEAEAIEQHYAKTLSCFT